MNRVFIGGIPRGGTTIALRLIGQHPDAFYWPGESSILPVVHALWSGGPPNKDCRAQIEDYVRDALRVALTEMQEWNAQEFNIADMPVVEPEQVAALSATIVDRVMEASSIRRALVEASSVLQEFLESYAPGGVHVEKTPANLFSYAHLSQEAQWVICHREPFAVISSIQERAGKDPFAMHWRTALEPCIGVYTQHAEYCIRALRSAEKPLEAQFEAVCAEPLKLQRGAWEKVGLRAPRQPLEHLTRAMSDKAAWRNFTPAERWKVLRLTETTRRLLGYDENYYGVSETEMTDGMTLDAESYVAGMSGVYEGEGEAKIWMESRAALAVWLANGASTVSLSFYNPARLNLTEQALTFRTGNRRVVAEAALADDGLTIVDVDLSKATPAGATSAGRLFHLDVEAARSIIPVASLPGVLDQRVLSALMTGWRVS